MSGRTTSPILRISKLIGFLGFYVKEVVLSNLRVARDVVSPRTRIEPSFLGIDLDPEMNDRQRMILANLITMTPGTLSVDIDPEGTVLYLHVMYADDPEELRRSIREDYSRRIKEVF